MDAFILVYLDLSDNFMQEIEVLGMARISEFMS
jgi:hypothetical protein